MYANGEVSQEAIGEIKNNKMVASLAPRPFVLVADLLKTPAFNASTSTTSEEASEEAGT